MANYCTDEDLVAKRPKILTYGVTSFESGDTDVISEATEIIDRVIEARWYREAAGNFGYDFRDTPFNQERLDGYDSDAENPAANTQLKRLAIYKSLELAYEYLMKDSPDQDGFERQMDNFAKKYKEELAIVLDVGLNYDWDAGGVVTSDEKYQKSTRTLERC